MDVGEYQRLRPHFFGLGDLARSLRAGGVTVAARFDQPLETLSSLERVASRCVSGRGPGRSETKHRRCDAIPA
jgi:hypothetical protein